MSVDPKSSHNVIENGSLQDPLNNMLEKDLLYNDIENVLDEDIKLDINNNLDRNYADNTNYLLDSNDEYKNNILVLDDDDLDDIHQIRDNDLNDHLFKRTGGLLIVCWNINGISKNIRAIIHYIIHTKKPDIFCIQEGSRTYSTPNFDFKIKGYNTQIMKKNGNGKVITLTRIGLITNDLDIKFKQNEDIDNNIKKLDINDDDYKQKEKGLLMSKLYAIATEIISKDQEKRTIVVNYYRPQNGTEGGSHINLLMDFLRKIMDKYPGHEIILCCDGNMHHLEWSDKESSNGKAKKMGNIFYNWSLENDWFILNNKDPTRVVNEQRTSPDVVAVFGIDPDTTNWWIENYGDIHSASDHRTIFTYIDDGDFTDDYKLEYVIRNGDNLNWEEFVAQLNDNKLRWYEKYGDKLTLLMSEIENIWNSLDPDKLKEIDNMDDILNKLGIDINFVIEGINALKDDVIVKAAADTFGLRIKRNIDEMPWITTEIQSIIDEYNAFMFKWDNLWSRKKKLRKKSRKESLEKEKEEILAKAHHEWIEQLMIEDEINGGTPWKAINNIIKYDTKSNKSIPVLYNKISKECEGITAQEKCETFLEHCHRHELPMEKRETNDEYEELLKEFKKKRWEKVDNLKYIHALNKLNGIISRNKIRRSVFSFNKKSATYDDKLSHQYTQKGYDIIQEPLYLVYNTMKFVRIRPQSLNQRFIVLLLKGGRSGKYKENYRQISISSNFGKPYDKINGYDLLFYGIDLQLIPIENFGFLKGLGCFDAVGYVLDRIMDNKYHLKDTHGVLLDYEGCFDTVDNELCLNIMHIDFKICGNFMYYLAVSMSNRWGRVKINGYYSKWRRDIIGLNQGWPPSPIIYIFFSADIIIVVSLDLGLFIVLFADDSKLLSDGTVEGEELERNINYALDLIHYIANRRGLKMQSKKQVYIVYPAIYNKENHKNKYFNLMMNGNEIKKEYQQVSYLGALLDVALTMTPWINRLYRNASNSFLRIQDRYKNAVSMKAIWMPQIYSSLIISKISYLMEYWSMGEKTDVLKLKNLYNKILRVCGGELLSTPLLWQCITNKWLDFEEMLNYKKSVGFSRIIRTPETNILHKRIKEKYWRNWSYERGEDNKENRYDLELKYMEESSLIAPELEVHGIKLGEIEIEGELYQYPSDNENWAKLQKEEKCDYEKKLNVKQNPFNEMFKAAKLLSNSDYHYMKNLKLEQIPKRTSIHYDPLLPPSNVYYYEEIEGDKKGFNMKWLEELVKKEKLDENRIQIIMSDGSVKSMYGGAGFFTANMREYKELNIKEIRENKFILSNKDIFNNISLYGFGAASVALRCSIDHCELYGAFKALDFITSYFDNIRMIDLDKVPTDIILAIDNEQVVKWIAFGETEDIKIRDKLIFIYGVIHELRKCNIKIRLIWQKGHAEEKGNELADDLAKLGMMNLYQTRYWKNTKKNMAKKNGLTLVIKQ